MTRVYRCSECDSTEHTAARCPILHPNGKRHDGLMWDAARWLAEQPDGTTFTTAGARFGVTREAVRVAWKALDLGETPSQKERASRQARAIELARTGKTLTEISNATRANTTLIRQWLKEAGVAFARCFADPIAIEAGLRVVASGGTVGEGASVAGLQYSRFHQYLKRAGISAGPLNREKFARVIGRGEQGALLVKTEGMSVGHAAMVVGCAPNTVRDWLARHEEVAHGVA